MDEIRCMHRLRKLIKNNLDCKAAAAAGAFTGNINACAIRKKTVLFNAVSHNCVRTIEALAARGDCDPNVGSVLHLAARTCGGLALAVLVSQFPTLDLHARDWAGCTALHRAAACGLKLNVELLLQTGANPTLLANGKTPADFARERGHGEVANLLAIAAAWYVGTRAAWITACAVVIGE